MKYICVIAVVLLFLSAPTAVKGEDRTITDEFEKEFAALLEEMPDEVKDKFSAALASEDGTARVQDELSFSSVFDRLTDTLESVWPSSLRLLVRLFGWVLVAGVFAQLKETYAASQVNAAFSFCMTLAFTLTLTDSVSRILLGAQSYISSLSAMSGAVAPIAVALVAASGQLSFAAVTHSTLMLVFSLLQNVEAVLFLPAVRLSYCIGIVGAVCTDARIERVSKCVRKVFTVAMTFFMLVVSFVIGVQSALAKSADSFSVRTVKFALGNMIPLIGGALSEAISTVSGSLSLIRSTAGGLCMIALLVLLLPILIELILHRLALVVCQSAAEMIGCEGEAKLIGEVHATFGYVLAVVSLTTALFLFVMALFVLIGGGTG